MRPSPDVREFVRVENMYLPAHILPLSRSERELSPFFDESIHLIVHYRMFTMAFTFPRMFPRTLDATRSWVRSSTVTSTLFVNCAHNPRFIRDDYYNIIGVSIAGLQAERAARRHRRAERRAEIRALSMYVLELTHLLTVLVHYRPRTPIVTTVE